MVGSMRSTRTVQAVAVPAAPSFADSAEPHGFPLLGHGQELQLLGLVEDTAWHPVWEEEFDSSPVLRKAIISGDGPFGPWMSIAHWALLSFTAIYALVPGTSGLSLLLPLTDEYFHNGASYGSSNSFQIFRRVECSSGPAQWNNSLIEILCHDINVHIPHHVSARIPHYNLRVAHKSLQENWGKEENHVAFDKLAPQESHPVTFLKRVMPDYA
ncbi:hypothetical protein D5086_032284 [Populus alba]|uniref:Uncharacterized protein n=1 Tax=Populus alba TaxID=43335 RepID=A0ACC4ALL7_POPAL